MQLLLREIFPRIPRRTICNFCLKIFKGGSTLVALNLLVTPAFPNLGTRFILRVVACHIPRFSKSCNVKIKESNKTLFDFQGQKKFLNSIGTLNPFELNKIQRDLKR